MNPVSPVAPVGLGQGVKGEASLKEYKKMAKKSTKGKTWDILAKELLTDAQTLTFEQMWQLSGRGSKQEAVISLATIAPDTQKLHQIKEAWEWQTTEWDNQDTPAKFRSHLSSWLNKGKWAEQLPPRRKDQPKDPAFCKCGSPATHRHPESLCTPCYAEKYSTINWRGETRPYLDVLQESLAESGLSIQEGETLGEFAERCKQKLTASPFLKQEGAVGMDEGKRLRGNYG